MLLNENYDYIFIVSFQSSNAIERHFCKCRPMSGGRFLVNMRAVNNSEKIITFNSIINEYMNFMINFMNL